MASSVSASVGLLAVGLEVESGDEHARDPEEDDVGPGDERAGGIEFLARAVLGAHGFVGPEPRGEPGVEGVGVLGPAFAGGFDLAADFGCEGSRVLRVRRTTGLSSDAST